MATIFSEDWTGSDAAAWNATNWPTITTTSTSTVAIQSNAGVMTPQGAGYAYCRAVASMASQTDFEAAYTITLAGASEQYHSIILRWDGAWTGNNPTNGYRFNVIDGFFEFKPYTAGVGGTAASVAKTWSTTLWNIRIHLEGSAVKVRIWQGAEPGTWDIDTTDTARSAGTMALMSMCGSTTTARPCTRDNLLVTTLTEPIVGLAPDAVAASTNLTGAVTDIDEDINSPGADWLTATDATLDTDVRVTFPTPT